MALKEAQPRAIKLSEYTPPAFLIDATELRFDLGDGVTEVTSTLTVRRNPEVESAPLTLSGAGLDTQRVEIDGRAATFEEHEGDEALIVEGVPEKAVVTIEVVIHPEPLGAHGIPEADLTWKRPT